MPGKLHFIAGLPRSGSTLLSAILRQNPRFCSGMSSPLAGVVRATWEALGAQNEFAQFITDAQRERVLRSVFESFYSEQNEFEVIFDTNRVWTSRLPLIKRFFPEAKVICCVRNPAKIVNSFEALIRNNHLAASRLFRDANERLNAHSRVAAISQPDRLLGLSLNCMQDGYYSENADMMLMVDYDILVAQPKKTVDLIYKFIGESAFEHDFDNVEYEAPEFDRSLIADGLHRVAGPIAPKPKPNTLPPDLERGLKRKAFWVDKPNPSAAQIIAS